MEPHHGAERPQIGERSDAILVVIGKTPNNYCADAPDVLGCVSTGRTLEEMKANIREALEGHFELMLETGETLPEPTARAVVVEGYNVAIHKEGDGWRAFAEDLWPFIVAADTPERAEALIREVLPDYLSNLRHNGQPVPEPTSVIVYVDVNLPCARSEGAFPPTSA